MFDIFKFVGILGLVIGLTGCKKDEVSDSTIEVQVNRDVNGEALEAVRCELRGSSLNQGSFNTNLALLQTQYTNGLGQVQFQQHVNNLVEMEVRLHKQGFFPHTLEFNKDDFRSRLFYAETTLSKIGDIRVRLHNEAPQTDNDELAFSLKTNEVDCPCCSDITRVLRGSSVDSSWTCSFPAGQYLHYEYTLKEQGNILFFQDSIWVNDDGETFIELQY